MKIAYKDTHVRDYIIEVDWYEKRAIRQALEWAFIYKSIMNLSEDEEDNITKVYNQFKSLEKKETEST